MKNIYIAMIILAFAGICVFGDNGKQEEIDYLLFLPNSGDAFADPVHATAHLDTVANYLRGKNILPGQIFVYGYAANVINDIDPVLLSRNRALFVIQELQKRGISSALFADPVGYGHVDLWGSNIDEPDRSPNRRVRILLGDIVLTQEAVAAETAETVNTAEAFISAAPTPSEKPIEKSAYPFPWRLLLWLLLPLLLILAAVLLASKRKKTEAAKPAPVSAPKAEPPKVEPPKAEPPKPAPDVAPKPEPPKVETPKAEPPKPAPFVEQPKVEPAKPIPAFVKEAEPVKPEPPKVEPPKEKVMILEKDEIRLYAYDLFERRYGQNGNDVLDWYQSINELTALYESQGYRVILYWDQEAQTRKQSV